MTTLTISTDTLIAAIKRVFPHASTDQTLPVLATIRFTTKGEYLVLSACDRYTIGETRIPLSEVDSATPVDFLVNAKQLKTLLPALKTTAYTFVMPRDNEDGAEFNGSHVAGCELERYPSTHKLWPESFEPAAAGNFGMSVASIKKLSALPQDRHEKSTPLVFGQGKDASPMKPFVILFGESTRVLVMPVRVGARGDGSASYASWDAPASTAATAAA